MNVEDLNRALAAGHFDTAGLFPHVEALRRAEVVFELDFGLAELPRQPGVLLIRGPRQYGKSTWLEQELHRTVTTWGPGAGRYLNGDELRDEAALLDALRNIAATYEVRAGVKRLFIDEITAVPHWQRALKRAIDGGELREVLVVTTGSRASDLRRGAELLPGRKGELERHHWLFTGLGFREFRRVCGEQLGEDTLVAYLLSGASPAAAAALATAGRLPEWVCSMTRDWMLGEISSSGRNRSSLLAVLRVLETQGGSPVGQMKLAREAGLANNTVAAGYVELLADLLCVGQQLAWDADRQVEVRRRPAKFPFINLLAAASWSVDRPRSVAGFRSLDPGQQGRWWEWLVAQELYRRAARRGELAPEVLRYWASKRHELDFAVGERAFVEVKRGTTSPLDFAWFQRVHPGGQLTVVGGTRFDTGVVRGVTFEDFLLDDGA